MKSIILLFILVGSFGAIAYADQYDELREYAKLVPISEINQEVSDYLSNETNEILSGLQAHYTLALFENIRTGRAWYILDGYYELKSGRILFLDFQYNPKSKNWWPIENYKHYVPAVTERYMLEADRICDPYKRHFIGIVGASLGSSSVDRVKQFFRDNYKSQPILVDNDGELTIIDPTKSARMTNQVLFTLNEQHLISGLSQSLGIDASILSSGRRPSSPELKQTYVGSTPSCMK